MAPLSRLYLPLALCIAAGFAAAQTNLSAHFADGQTWLTWDDNLGLSGVNTYDVYRSNAPIASLGSATLAGRLLPEDWKAERLQKVQSGLRWRIPTGAGGMRTLTSNEALFVSTPRGATPEYFAVVRHGNTALNQGNTTGPVAQSLSKPKPQVQATGVEAGQAWTAYALWVDGDDTAQGGRSDFRPMASADGAGVGHLFMVFEPQGGAPGPGAPAVCALHGGFGDLMNLRPSQGSSYAMNLSPAGAWYVTVDDAIFAVDSGLFGGSTVKSQNTRWIGYWPGFDRFHKPMANPPVGSVVIDYTERRLDFILDWLVSDLAADPERLSMWGISMGGAATSFYARTRPERLASAHAVVAPVAGPENDFSPFMQGSAAQNLALDITGYPAGLIGVTDLYDPAASLPGADRPWIRHLWGTQDGIVGWADKPAAIAELDAGLFGGEVDWDERHHVPSFGGWLPGTFLSSPRHDVDDLLTHRRNRAFPAFGNVDQNAALAGKQPSPGTGVEPANGDAFGTLGGWFEWDRGTSLDTKIAAAFDLWVVSASSFSADIPAPSSATCDLAVRRSQLFVRRPFEPFAWKLEPVGGGAPLASGVAQMRADGLAVVEDLALNKAPARLTLQRAADLGGTLLFGSATGGASLPTLSAQVAPKVGDAGFVLSLGAAPVSTGGVGLLGFAPAADPFSGLTLYCFPLLVFPLAADGAGSATWALPVPADPVFAGFEVYTQGVWVDPGAPGGFAATPGLALVVQP